MGGRLSRQCTAPRLVPAKNAGRRLAGRGPGRVLCRFGQSLERLAGPSVGALRMGLFGVRPIED
jgi:hypothetical protein